MTVHVPDGDPDGEFEASRAALRDILYAYLDICGDCLPAGDWTRAERGATDPFRYLDIRYRSAWLFRTGAELRVLHHGAAVLLLCRLAELDEDDDGAGVRAGEAFAEAAMRSAPDDVLAAISAARLPIYQAWRAGRVTDEPTIQAAFRAAFSPGLDLYGALQAVRERVILPTFADVAAA